MIADLQGQIVLKYMANTTENKASKAKKKIVKKCSELKRCVVRESSSTE